MKLKIWLRVSVALALSSLALVGASVVVGSEMISRGTKSLSTVERTLDALLEQSRLLSPADMGHRRMDIRIFVINSQLSQAEDPIVIVGDSLTEAALLPPQVCGRPVVNAGIGGATPSNYLRLIRANGLLADMNAGLVIVALGTNNAQTIARMEDFEQSYNDLLSTLALRSRKIVLMQVPPIGKGILTKYFEPSRVQMLNVSIQKTAERLNIKTIALKNTIETIDGVHLSPAGYIDWTASIAAASKTALGCAPTAQSD